MGGLVDACTEENVAQNGEMMATKRGDRNGRLEEDIRVNEQGSCLWIFEREKEIPNSVAERCKYWNHIEWKNKECNDELEETLSHPGENTEKTEIIVILTPQFSLE